MQEHIGMHRAAMGSSGIRRLVVDTGKVEEVSCHRLQVLRCWWCFDVLDVSRRAASRSFKFRAGISVFHQGKRIRTKESKEGIRISGI
jgi:hypothetical protein